MAALDMLLLLWIAIGILSLGSAALMVLLMPVVQPPRTAEPPERPALCLEPFR